MSRDYTALLSADPAWPALAESLATAKNGAVVFPSGENRRAVLEELQVTTRSTLGAIAHETGGIAIDHGWLRMFGSGSAQQPRALGAWNREVGFDVADALLIADDAAGGVFAINGGALGTARGNVYYFAPDCLEWEDTELGHTDWVEWALNGDLGQFYENMRWPGWVAEVEALAGDRAFHFFPPPWTEEGEDVSKVDRRVVPSRELFGLMIAEMGGDGEDGE